MLGRTVVGVHTSLRSVRNSEGGSRWSPSLLPSLSPVPTRTRRPGAGSRKGRIDGRRGRTGAGPWGGPEAQKGGRTLEMGALLRTPLTYQVKSPLSVLLSPDLVPFFRTTETEESDEWGSRAQRTG